MKLNVEPMDFGFEYSSWKLLHQPISQVVLNILKPITMRQIDVFISIEAMIVKLFTVNFAPVCEKL